MLRCSRPTRRTRSTWSPSSTADRRGRSAIHGYTSGTGTERRNPPRAPDQVDVAEIDEFAEIEQVARHDMGSSQAQRTVAAARWCVT